MAVAVGPTRTHPGEALSLRRRCDAVCVRDLVTQSCMRGMNSPSIKNVCVCFGTPAAPARIVGKFSRRTSPRSARARERGPMRLCACVCDCVLAVRAHARARWRAVSAAGGGARPGAEPTFSAACSASRTPQRSSARAHARESLLCMRMRAPLWPEDRLSPVVARAGERGAADH